MKHGAFRSSALRTLLEMATLVVAFAQPSAAERAVPPPPRGFVHDEAGWLSATEEDRLSRLLLAWERDTSNQLVIAVFRSLEGEDLATFSHRVAETWAIGGKEKDNGIFLAVYAEEQEIDIEVGYGLEPVVTDAIASEIIREVLRPAFREGHYYDGLEGAARQFMAAAAGEFKGTGRALGDRPVGNDMPPFLVVILVLVLLFAFSAMRRSAMGPVIFGSPSWGRHGRLDVPPLRVGGRGGFGRGGFGGGFRGGGGSFGGGGARGRW